MHCLRVLCASPPQLLNCVAIADINVSVAELWSACSKICFVEGRGASPPKQRNQYHSSKAETSDFSATVDESNVRSQAACIFSTGVTPA